MEAYKKELAQINKKLSNVLTKDDQSLKETIKDIVNQMKSDILSSVKHRIDLLENKLFDKEQENDALKAQLKQVEKALDDQKDENEKLKSELAKDKDAKDEKLNDLEQYSRRNNIRINGIPEESREDELKTVDIVMKTLNGKIPNLDLKETDIDIAHHLGKKESSKNRQIIVKFVSRTTRDKIMKEKKQFKGSPIYLNEDLTKINQLVLSCLRKKMPDEVETA